MFSNKRLAVLLVLFFAGCTSSRINSSGNNTLPAASLHPYGRYIFTSQQDLELISSAVHAGFTFEGKECRIFASLPQSGSHNYLQYELDGVYQKRIKITGTDQQPVVISAPKGGTHTIWLYKNTEAATGAIIIRKITGNNIRSIEKPPAPIIEFIGNSITCGAAADTVDMPCNTGEYHDHHNAYNAYGPRVARALGTEYILSSVSGIGMYRNWNSNGPAMPEVYDKVDFKSGTHTLWNFNLFIPDIVSIALGTNDFSMGDGKKERLPFDSAAFVSKYIDFAEMVGRRYPLARIVLLSSPMLNGEAKQTLENCLRSVKQKIDLLHPLDKPVVLYFFKPMHGHGCGGHPSVEDHAVLAKELIPLFSQLLPLARK